MCQSKSAGVITCATTSAQRWLTGQGAELACKLRTHRPGLQSIQKPLSEDPIPAGQSAAAQERPCTRSAALLLPPPQCTVRSPAHKDSPADQARRAPRQWLAPAAHDCCHSSVLQGLHLGSSAGPQAQPGGRRQAMTLNLFSQPGERRPPRLLPGNAPAAQGRHQSRPLLGAGPCGQPPVHPRARSAPRPPARLPRPAPARREDPAAYSRAGLQLDETQPQGPPLARRPLRAREVPDQACRPAAARPARPAARA